MKATGIVRELDDLGRIVLPIELRRNLNLSKRDPVEIFVDENRIILQKYQPSCLFCGSMEHIIMFNDQKICEDCLRKLKEFPL